MTDDRGRLYVGGQWETPSTSDRITVRSASTEEVIGSVPEAAPADVDAAVSAARRAFDDPSGWATWEPGRRAEILERLAGEYEARAEQIFHAVSAQNGMPITLARQIETYPPVLLRYYAGLIRKEPVSEVRAGLFTRTATLQRQGIGVVTAIVPWNVPQSLTATKLAPALAAGCTVVVKPSPETALDAFLLADAKVAFTGSTAAGRLVAKACAERLRPVTLELGGKSAVDENTLIGPLASKPGWPATSSQASPKAPPWPSAARSGRATRAARWPWPVRSKQAPSASTAMFPSRPRRTEASRRAGSARSSGRRAWPHTSPSNPPTSSDQGAPEIHMTASRRALRVVVVGAGIGGLAAAAALRRAGTQVEVYERAKAVARVGAGLQLAPNATSALRGMGLLPQACAIASRPESWCSFSGADGELTLQLPLGDPKSVV